MVAERNLGDFFYYLRLWNPKAVVPQRHENPNRQRPRHPNQRQTLPRRQFPRIRLHQRNRRQVVTELKNKGYDSELLVPEEDDIPLTERVRRTNAHCQALGKSNVLLISLHLNAADDGTKWMSATGWSCYTCKGQTESDRLADCLYKAAEQILKNQVIRTDCARDGDPDWEESFYILRKTPCTAVLSENYFMDNKSDLEYLQSKAGKQAIIDTHFEGIVEYLLGNGL